jgi:molybdopterin molybdotransferase
MISPSRALKQVMSHCTALGAGLVAIDEALGLVLAENVRAPEPLPRFDNTAMDGYAIRAANTSGAAAALPVRLSVVESVFAGEVTRRRIRDGQACRIMTGAPVPPGADTVAAKEEVTVDAGDIVLDHPVRAGQHIRRRGEEMKSGTAVLNQGVTVDAGVTACLATFGRRRVRVFRRPRVSVIATGSETIAPGRKLAPGQIYDSNSFMLAAALREMGIAPARVRHVGDHPTALRNAVAAALRVSDALVVTGGVSVGDRDYVREVLARLGVEEIFWRVKQKPGKPLYFGTRGRRIVFGLPGNPASVYTCFYVYVYPALRRMAGHGDEGLPERTLPLASDVESDAVRWRFLKARTIDGPTPRVMALPRQASHMISSLAQTDSLIVVPPAVGRIAAGTDVTTWRLPTAGGG